MVHPSLGTNSRFPWPGNDFETSLVYKGVMDEQRRAYISYLLRLQRVREHGRWIWRASLEDAESGERISFPDLQSLFCYLESTTRSETPEEGADMALHGA